MSKAGRHKEGKETREKVLAAARQLIAENGYSATSISMISKASGVKPASIYWAFESKEGLLAAVLNDAADDFFDTNFQLGAPPAKSIHAAMKSAAKSIATQPDFLRLLLIMSTERQNGDPKVLEAARRIRNMSREGLEKQLAPFVSAPTPDQKQAILHDASRLAIMLFDGTFISTQLEARDSSPDHLADLVAIAVGGAIDQLAKKHTGPKQEETTNEPATDSRVT